MYSNLPSQCMGHYSASYKPFNRTIMLVSIKYIGMCERLNIPISIRGSEPNNPPFKMSSTGRKDIPYFPELHTLACASRTGKEEERITFWLKDSRRNEPVGGILHNSGSPLHSFVIYVRAQLLALYCMICQNAWAWSMCSCMRSFGSFKTLWFSHFKKKHNSSQK